MSAYKRIVVNEFKDREVLLEALTRLGIAYTVHEKPAIFSPYGGAHRPGMMDISLEQESITKVFGLYSMPIGVRFNSKQQSYDFVVNDMGHRETILNKVKQAYIAVAIEEAMKRQRFTVESMDLSQEEVDLCGVKVL
jgi:hypothetical protein